MRLPTASELDRAKVCPASSAFPPSGNASSASARGTAIHAYVLGSRTDAAVKPDPEYADFCSIIDLEAIPTGRYEVAYAYDWKTGVVRLIGERIARNYGQLRSSEFAGSIDIVNETTVGDKRAAYIADLKTGLAMHVPPAGECLQLGFAAVCEARLTGCDFVVADIIRLADNGTVYPERHTFDRFGLEAVEAELVEIAQRVEKAAAVVLAGAVPPVFTGPHCTYCPAMTKCPEHTSNMRLMVADPKAFEKRVMEALTPETAKQAYFMYKQAKEFLDRIGGSIYGFATQCPIDLGNGMVLGPVSKMMPRINATEAYRVIEEIFGEDVARASVEWKTSKSAIREALKPISPNRGLAQNERAVLLALEKAGAISYSERTEIRAHKDGGSHDEG
jgi:hypothetical protein